MKDTCKIMKMVLAITIICISLLLSLTAPAIAVEYEYTEIPTPSWWESVYPMDINDKGTVVGRVGLELPPMGWPVPSLHIEKGFLYKGNWYTEMLPTLLLPRYRVAQAASVNNKGVVVGSVATLIPFYPIGPFLEVFRKGFIYWGGIYIELLPPGWRQAYADYIADNGTVLGHGTELLNGKTKWFIYDGWKYTVLLPPGWAEVYEITDMNNSGDVVGRGNAERGFLYSEGHYSEIVPPGCTSSYVRGINDNGEMIMEGQADYPSPVKHFIYSNNTYTEIALVPLYINNAGAVIGEALESVPDFAYSKKVLYVDGNYTVLLPPGWRWVVGVRINNRNEVAGWGIDGNGINKVFIYSNGEYTELLPPGWIDATTEYIYSYVYYDISSGWPIGRTWINDNGSVAAWGHDANGKQKAFIAVPAAN